ncbi:MAG: UvrD-helicase domain-containing protein, partial [Alphaproteobacteria bacterium]|nr:UvrD-helicase domain-containing protein [Alphaproteobacteria bacterium]
MTAARRKTATASPTPRDNQLRASNPGDSVWVNASAGSGKTTVLTKRVTRLLLAGVRPEKILCLTYTRAGAAEMAARITKQFGEWVGCDDAALDEDLFGLQDREASLPERAQARRLFAQLLACPGGLRIRTIHSFCQEILSRFPLEAGLQPHFALIEEQELETLKNEIIGDLLRDAAAEPGGDLVRALAVLVETQGEHGFDKMLQSALRECGRLAADVDELMARLRGFLGLEPGDTADGFRRAAMARLPEEDLRQMAAALAKGSAAYQARGAMLAEILATPPERRAARFEDYCGTFLTKQNEPFAAKTVATKEMRAGFPGIDDIAGREAARLLSVLERIEAADIARVTESVLTFGAALSERLAAAKSARAALDYDDLILYAERLLRRDTINPWIAYKLDQGIDHILVDEAQDTSRAQWNIVQALTSDFFAGQGARGDENRTLFVVGDEKQSIF